MKVGLGRRERLKEKVRDVVKDVVRKRTPGTQLSPQQIEEIEEIVEQVVNVLPPQAWVLLSWALTLSLALFGASAIVTVFLKGTVDVWLASITTALVGALVGVFGAAMTKD